MFGSKKEKSSMKPASGIRHANLATLIAPDVKIVGDLEFGEGLRIDGSVKGNVTCKPGNQALLVLSEHGAIEGNAHGYDVVVNGRIIGDLIADHFVDLQSNAHVTGNIHYQQLQMDCGASVDGRLTHHEAGDVKRRIDDEAGAAGLQKPESKDAAVPDGERPFPQKE